MLLMILGALRSNLIEWQELMYGRKRIFSYFLQFIPFRVMCLRQILGDGAFPYYIGTTWTLDEVWDPNATKKGGADPTPPPGRSGPESAP